MKNIGFFLSENFQFWVMKFSIYLNRRVFVISQLVIFYNSQSDDTMTVTSELFHSVRTAFIDNYPCYCNLSILYKAT